jgi:hypothetical protein
MQLKFNASEKGESLEETPFSEEKATPGRVIKVDFTASKIPLVQHYVTDKK